MDGSTAHDALIPFSGDDWFDPLEEAVRFQVRGFIEAMVEAELQVALGGRYERQGQAKGILAAKIIGILDDRKLSTRKAQALTGIDQAEFVRIRNAKLGRFTIDRLMTIINKLDHQVEIRVEVHPAMAHG